MQLPINKILFTIVLFLFFEKVNGQQKGVAVLEHSSTYTWDVPQPFSYNNSNSNNPSVLSKTIAGSCTKMCEGDCQYIQAIPAGGVGPYTYIWSPNIGNGPGPYLVCPTNTSIYTATIIDALGTYSTTLGCQVTIWPAYTSTNINTTISNCNGVATATVTGATGPYTYNWSNNQNSQVLSNLSSGIYTVTVTDANGCSTTTASTLDIGPPPIVSFDANIVSGCGPLCVDFTNTTPNFLSFNWMFGDGDSDNTISNATHCYNIPGIYSVSLEVTDNNGCSNVLVKNNYIDVYTTPVALFTSTPSGGASILTPLIEFTDQSTDPNSWNWNFGDDTHSSSSDQNTSFTYTDVGTYPVTLIVTSIDGCTDTITQMITISPEYIVSVPNTFTPNNDGLNDVFLPLGAGIDANGYELFIYNRWGQQIFSSSNILIGWNGRSMLGNKGPVQEDTYVWVIRLKDNWGNKHELKGHINVLR